jgi:hypothetical protein
MNRIIIFVIAPIIIFVALFIIEYFFLTHINFHKYQYPKIYDDIDTNITFFGDFNNRLSIGKEKAKQSKIVVCGLCRNVEKSLPKFFQRIKKTCRMFNEYKIVCFENDSEDFTRQIIKKESEIDNNIILLDCCETECDCKLKTRKMYDYGMFSLSRIEKMSSFRNKYIEYVKKNLGHYDYMLVIDTDLMNDGEYNDNGILHSLSFNFDAIAINGRVSFPGSLGLLTLQYDGLAYIGYNDNINNNVLYSYYKMNKSVFDKIKLDKTTGKTGLIPVSSAFNGMCLYNIKSILNSKYDHLTSCEHKDFHLSIIRSGHSKIFINPYFVGYFKAQGSRSDISSFFKI